MQLSGILEQEGSGGIVRVDFKSRIRQVEVSRQHLNGAPFGFRVVVQVPDDQVEEFRPKGEVIKVLGDPALPNVAMEGILEHYGLSMTFPRAVQEAADKLPAQPSEEDIARELADRRIDLRDLPTFTIDGLSAKDLDDALSIEPLDNGGYRLYVHIADVGHYVKFGSPLDREAAERGNSYYLADRVIPMLPPELSNGLCSLTAGHDRFTMTCEMTFTNKGKRDSAKVYESLTRSDLRGSYEELARIFPKQKDLSEGKFSESDVNQEVLQKLGSEYESFLETFIMLQNMGVELRKRRMQEGALNFDFSETQIVLDVEGKVTDVHAAQSDWTNQIIEECMVAANVAVAERYGQAGAPIIYRVHENPDREQFEHFKEVARLQGASLGAIDMADQKSVARVIENLKTLPASETLMTLLLRSLAKARYDYDPLGHYALAEEWYAHFTAPIRRYSDLVTHRALKRRIRGEKDDQKEKNRLPAVTEHISETERNAINAERDSNDQKIAEYMEQFTGQSFDVEISGIMQSGIFVRLPNTIEGMVAFRTMNDYYVYDEYTLSAKGADHGRHFRLGDKLRVKLQSVNTIRRFIDFVIQDELESGHDGKAKDDMSVVFDESIKRQNEARKELGEKPLGRLQGQGRGRSSNSDSHRPRNRRNRSGQDKSKRRRGHAKPIGGKGRK